ncbi:hypothetical protein [Rubinisphaera italica]|uniref:hypothetical protein n=1 Tax=Rubinisphaera italica TaxID=2527969 RepID=UPI0011B376A8|nr:hypothetical protein [Rubinisphaera italica]
MDQYVEKVKDRMMPNSEIHSLNDVILRIDRVGSYRLVLSDEVMIGGPTGAGTSGQIALFSQLSTNHAVIARRTNGYTIRPAQGAVSIKSQTTENGSLDVEKPENLLIQETCLTNNCRASLGNQVTVSVRRKSPLSQTAVLEVDPLDRMVDRVDGVILMENLLLMGPGSQAHIRCPHWEQSGVLIYQQGRFHFRSPVGRETAAEQKMVDLSVPFDQHVEQDDFGFYLETLY